MKLVMISNGAIFDAERVNLIARQDLNEYVISVDGIGGMKANLDDVTALKKFLDITDLTADALKILA